jgi:DNA-binding CsgD family transcriptional regulator
MEVWGERMARWEHRRWPLVDRGSERVAIDDLLERVRQGLSGVLVLRGGDGVGKSRLVEYAADVAAGFRVSVVDGVESEIDLAYGAVHQLLIPFLPLIDELPAPHRQALQVAFGLVAGRPPEPLLVGLACLTLLSRAGANEPVLGIVDDAHWIDAESAVALGFLSRRLYADRVGVILTVASAGMPPALRQLPMVEVGDLPAQAAAELLRSVAGTSLEPAVVDRVVADTERNPLALVDIGAHHTAEELAARAYLPAPMPVGEQLQERYLRRIHGLPPEVQKFLLLVASDVSGDRGRVARAAAAAGIDTDAAESAAEAAELIEVSGNCVRFRYPLIRAAVYHGASDLGRRRAHHWLGQASGSQGDSDGQVWHRAAAAAGPDEDLAADLEAAAGRARDRGASPARAMLLRSSVVLTPDQGIRAGREVALARAELASGHPHAAQEIAGHALPHLSDSIARGDAKAVIGNALFAQGRDVEAAEVLANASAELAADQAASADALLAALDAAMWVGRAETSKITVIPPPPPPGAAPRVADLLLAGYQARLTTGYAAGAAPLRAAVAALRSSDLDPRTALRTFDLGSAAAGSLWDDQALLDITDLWVRATRALGAVSLLPLALAARAFADQVAGRLDQAADRWAELRELTAASQDPGLLGIHSHNEGLLLAYRDEPAKARAAGLAQIRESTARGQDLLADIGRIIIAIADMRAGQYEAAVDAALPVIRNDTPFTAETALPELIEAAARSGHQDVARGAFATLADRTTTAGTPWALGIRARCQALLEDGGDAEEAYLEAISQLGRSHAALDLARAHLLYGQWLRRSKRRRDARRHLRTAEGMFHTMGAGGLADQAGGELRATGERGRARTPQTESDLTAQEARVAKLAADGATNNEIAEQLFISPSTVDYHLGKVFRKLGVRSRAQLARRLLSS